MPEAGPVKGKIKFKIVSPLKVIEEREVDSVLLPLETGNALILPRRAPLLAAVKTGKVIVTDGGKKESYFVSSGIAEIRRDICSVCAWGIAEKDVKIDEIKAQINHLEQHQFTMHSDLEKQTIQALMRFLKSIIN